MILNFYGFPFPINSYIFNFGGRDLCCLACLSPLRQCAGLLVAGDVGALVAALAAALSGRGARLGTLARSFRFYSWPFHILQITFLSSFEVKHLLTFRLGIVIPLEIFSTS